MPLPGKPAALDLFVSHRSALVTYARSIIGSSGQAEDLVQEAWLRFDEASRGRFIEDATGYLYRIVRNLALDSKRRLVRENRVTAAGDYDEAVRVSADAAPNPETVALYKDQYAIVAAALAELPERTRLACEMHRFGGAKLREIAEFLDISVPLAHKLVADGIDHCKQRLGQA
ncbi:sigma-70 family RNA polymerase sigma factor [Thalassospira alkalitolerans]|uniref:RNA polymerase subunit sigma24 n=1 Tax=Thalassospira alkalitolerans TaxID=1293890 RepID=A0A1Y2LAJ8_9PROT|nr:sigma-70 family RNA polymerase sigma factor [Thalassospira alkalitolerans]OSQ47410.1 RNA polymerase subunit sigma24 [Thalassospira alkalitolerans]